MSELQEEGINAINLPLSPIPFELDPEDTMLGNSQQFYILTWKLDVKWSVVPGMVSNVFLLKLPEENEVRTMVDPNSRNDPKLQELMKVMKACKPSWESATLF